MDARLPAVLTEIRSLLDAPADAAPPSQALVEETLTTGYAYALGLDGERLRIERRLRELLRGGRSPRARSEEANRLTGLLAQVDQELAGLRALLSSLRTQARR